MDEKQSEKNIFDEIEEISKQLSFEQFKAPETPDGRFVQPSLYLNEYPSGASTSSKTI